MQVQYPTMPCTDDMTRWWRDLGVVLRFTRDLVADELQRLRPGGLLDATGWHAGTTLDADLGADSLEIMQLATALSETTHLHEAGIDDALLVKRSLGDWAATVQDGLEHNAARLTFRTSGSTGIPKPCTHALSSLQQETRALALLLPQRARVLCAVPSHHIYGFLWSVLLPRAQGIGADDIIDLRAMSPATIRRMLAPGDLVIGHPAFWDAVGRLTTRCAPDVIGITSTGPCPAALGDMVRSAGIARFIDIYGSSETGGIGWRALPEQRYRLLSCWRRAPGDDDRLVRIGAVGDGNADAPGGGGAGIGAADAVTLQDRITWHGGDLFTIGGRIDNAVQVGGINVFPAQVAELLERHPKVGKAMVRLMRPDEGDRLKAFIVPAEGLAGDRQLTTELDAFLQDKLKAPSRPRSYTFGAALPVRSTGKAGDWIIPGNGID